MKEDNKPKVSVLLSVYNGEKYLEKAISSILNQTFSDFEFIIIDDGSSDRSPEIIKSFNDNRIRYFKNEKNIGLVKSLNKGLEKMKGEYIARMDADDICKPTRFEKQVNFLNKNHEVGVLGTAMEIVDHKGSHISNQHFPKDHIIIFWKLFFETAVFHPTIMMRTNIVKKAGGYDPDFIH